MKKLLFILAFPLFLQGCVFAVGAAAGAAGAVVVYDHRSVAVALQDQKIVNEAAVKLRSSSELMNNSHINIACFNQVVLLSGEASTPELRQQAETLVKSVPNIKRIYNEITIQGPTSSLTRASDSWITTKIKTQMLATKDLKSGTIKVVTENGTVYLLGVVKREQADIAVDIARQVSGVQKVVKIFQYTD